MYKLNLKNNLKIISIIYNIYENMTNKKCKTYYNSIVKWHLQNLQTKETYIIAST